MSSYETNNYSILFEFICKKFKPDIIVEFGILNGYSTDSFLKSVDSNTPIIACDIFEDFIGNHPSFEVIKEKYSNYSNVKVKRLNYFDSNDLISSCIGKKVIFHVDIANNADVYKFAVEHMLFPGSMCILEGGSVARDNVEWMIKYNKPAIAPFLDQLKSRKLSHDFVVLNPYPSLTIFSEQES